MNKSAANKAKQHTVYKTKDGQRVPGATTITGILNKPALVAWANKIGLQGIEVAKYVDELASIGTLIHSMVEHHLKGLKLDLNDYTPNQIDTAENGFLKYLEWEKQNHPKLIASELCLVSEEMKYGGTIDAIMEIDGKTTLVDFKSSKGIFPEHFLQVAGGYAPLVEENGYKIDDIRILRIGRDENEGFDYLSCPNRELNEKKFKLCLEIHKLDKQLRRK